MSAPAPLVSIVTTLEYPRDRPMDCLRSWLQETLPNGAQTEMILVASGRHRWFEKQVPPILREQDRIIPMKTRDEMAMYDAAVREAKGEWILFTEPHCVAEPGCIAALLHHCEANQLAGACVRTLPTPEGLHRMIRMEALLYDEAAEIWTKDGDWRKFTKRGTLLKKSAYLEAGGLPAGQLRYGETTLAATLHAKGLRVGYAPEAAITHYNPTDMGELLGYVWEFRRKEREIARKAQPKKGTVSRAEADPSLAETFAANPALLRHVQELMTRKEMAEVPDLPPVLGKGRRVLQRLFGPPRLAAKFVSLWIKLQDKRLSEPEAYGVFKKVWQTFGDLSVALQGPLPAGDFPVPRALDAAAPLHPGEVDASYLAGCHALEHYCGTDFRWTAPISILRYQALEQVPRVTLEFLEARKLKGREMRVWWNRTLLAFQKEASSPGCWIFEPKAGKHSRRPVPDESDDFLVIICPPVQGNVQDPRLLGLALKSVTVTPSPREPEPLPQPAPGAEA